MGVLISILLATLLTACDMREVTETEDPVTEAAGNASDPNILKAVVEGLATPSRYRVVIEWNENAGAYSLYRRQSHTAYQKMPSSSGKFIDDTVTSGEMYRYALFATSELQSTSRSASEIEVAIPRDLVIDRPLLIQEIVNYHRLFLSSAGVVRGNGVLKIDVKEIHSDGGKIENRTHGGGVVTIQAERAVGRLAVETWGADGAEGRPGSEGLPGKNGKAGEDGTIAPRGLTTRLAGQLQEVLAKEKRTVNDLSETQMKDLFECKTSPTDGEPGEKGGPGGIGARGADGSDSGKIWVKVRYSDELHLSTRVESGKGGVGGKAGVGGLGGLGGDPGKDYFVCRKAQRGKNGLSGEVGKPGDSGGSGVTLTPCLLLGATKVGDCESSPRL